MKKGSKKVKKQPFAKRESSGAMSLIVALTVFNLVYSYAAGLPLPRQVVASYVESVEALGDAQVASYELMGSAVAAAITTVGNAMVPSGASTQVASPVVYSEDYVEPEPPPLLLVSPNQISLATL